MTTSQVLKQEREVSLAYAFHQLEQELDRLHKLIVLADELKAPAPQKD